MHALLFSTDRTADWIETLLTIENERGEVVDFKLYPQQRLMLAEQTGRDVTVKGRQTRASSLILARNLRRLTTSFGLKALVMTQDDQTTMLFRDRIRHHLRDLSNRGFNYPLVADNKDEMVIGTEMNNHVLFGCLAGDTQIRLQDGFIAPIPMARGQIWTHTGRKAPVKEVVFSGEREVVEVRMAGETIRCTPDHRFRTKEGWTPAERLAGKWVAIPYRRLARGYDHAWRATTILPAWEGAIGLTRDFGYVVGLFLAEGSLFNGGLHFYLSSEEYEIGERILTTLAPFSGRIFPHPEGRKAIVVEVCSRALQRLFADQLYRQGDKALPDVVLRRSPRPFLEGIAQGYIEGDGDPQSTRQRLTITSTRPQLLTQLQDLLASLYHVWGPIGSRPGYFRGRPTRRCYYLRYGGADNYLLRETFDWPMHDRKRRTFRTSHRGGGQGMTPGYHWIKVKSVKPAGRADTFDIVTNHPDHSFRTLSAAVHNSGEERVAGRAYAAQIVHLSEIAHWKPENAGDLLGGITPSVPGPPVGWFDMESTPNGAAGQFYDYCMDARDKDDLLQRWSLHFYPWWLEPRYRAGIVGEKDCDLQLPPNELERLRLGFKPDNHESFLVDHHDLSVDQLIWRRWRERELLRTGVPFLQEYIEDVDSCFITGEGNFFASPDGLDHLAYYKSQTANPGFKLDELPYKDSRISFYGPHLHVWERPDPVQVYVAYLDCAEGGVGRENDYTALVVVNAFTRHHAATLRLRAAPTECGMMAAAVAQYYNKALLGGERGTYGSAALERIRDLRYPNIYYHVDYDKPNKAREPWIYPTQAHRDEMLRVFRESIFERTFLTRDDDLVKEMGSFSWEKVRGGQIKARAAKRKHDDLVIAASGATYLCRRYARHQMDKEQSRETILTGPTGVVIGRVPEGSAPLPWLR